MSGIACINYSDAQAGRMRKRTSPMHPLGAHIAALGATHGGSNEFVDADLTLGEEHFENIRALIKSARKQGHDGIEIRLTPESFSAIQSRVVELAVLEDVEVNTKFYGEHLGREIIVVTFANVKHKWLLESAKLNLSLDEYNELHQLVSSRVTRTEREVSLTERAVSSNRKAERREERFALVSPEYDFGEFCRRMFGKDPNQITSAASAEITYAQQNERKRTGGGSFRLGSRGGVYCDNLQDLIGVIMGTVPDNSSPVFQTALRPLAHHLLQKWAISGLRQWLVKNDEE